MKATVGSLTVTLTGENVSGVIVLAFQQGLPAHHWSASGVVEPTFVFRFFFMFLRIYSLPLVPAQLTHNLMCIVCINFCALNVDKFWSVTECRRRSDMLQALELGTKRKYHDPGQTTPEEENASRS